MTFNLACPRVAAWSCNLYWCEWIHLKKQNYVRNAFASSVFIHSRLSLKRMGTLTRQGVQDLYLWLYIRDDPGERVFSPETWLAAARITVAQTVMKYSAPAHQGWSHWNRNTNESTSIEWIKYFVPALPVIIFSSLLWKCNLQTEAPILRLDPQRCTEICHHQTPDAGGTLRHILV